MKRLLLLMLLLIPFAGCKAGQGDRCAKSEDCGSGLVCFAPTEAQGSFIKARSYADLEPYLDSYTCVTPEDLAEAAQAYLADKAIAEEKAAQDRAIAEEKAAQARCRASWYNCKKYGRCTALYGYGSCQATSDADCRASNDCKEEGNCTAKDGRCQATSDADCRASETCQEYGRCTASEVCQEYSNCTAKDGWCEVTSDADCKGSTVCSERDWCTAKDGSCVK